MSIEHISGTSLVPASPDSPAYESGHTPENIIHNDPALEAAVVEAGEHPGRAAELAADLGIGMILTDTDTAKEPAAEPLVLRDSDPNGSPMRVSIDGKGETYALRHPDGRLVADDFRKEDDGLTVFFDQAAMTSSYVAALRLRDV